MKRLAAFGVLMAAFGAVTPAAAVTLELSPAVTKEINVTTASTPGWLPVAGQQQRAIQTIEVFLDAVEQGRDDEAYGMLNAITRQQQPREAFVREAERFRAVAGSSKFWRVQKVTWTKDPAQAPFSGIYAAIDLVAQFTNVDRYCGFMVVYQPPDGGEFSIMRRESTYLDNVTARSIEEKHSKSELVKAWAQASTHCPNYVAP